jgi:hypothetical protein
MTTTVGQDEFIRFYRDYMHLVNAYPEWEVIRYELVVEYLESKLYRLIKDEA